MSSKFKETFHLNDKTMKYMSFAQSKRQHQYLNLPGEYRRRLPQEMVFPDMTSARADELYCNDDDLLIDLEEESDDIDVKTLNKFAKYIIFVSYWYFKRKPYLAVLCHNDPGKDSELFEYVPSLFIRVHYIHFNQDKLWEKYENVIRRVKDNEILTDIEALDIAFVSKFISKNDAPYVVEKLSEAFHDAINKMLKLDVKVILSGMILRHIKCEKKQYELMEMIGMREIRNEFDEIIHEFFEEKIEAKDKEIENKDKTINSQAESIKNSEKTINSQAEAIKTKNAKINNLQQSNNDYKKLIKKLDAMDDLTPEVRQIINALMLVR